MVPNISRSRVHLISTHVFILASLILLTGVIAIISAKSNGGLPICCSENADDCTISELIKCCDNNNISTLNSSNINVTDIVDMKLDFCVDAFPLAFLLSIEHQNSTNCSLHKPEKFEISCSDIKGIRKNDTDIKHYHDSYVDILERSEFSLDAQDKSANKSEKCAKAYKDWLCSSTKHEYKFNNIELKGCESTSRKVCLECPSFKPKDTYGGFMAFQCNESKEDEVDDDNSCLPKCISSERLAEYKEKVRKSV